MGSLKKFSRLAFAALVIGLGVGYVLADWRPPGGSPSNPATYNAPEPLNISNRPQVKEGGLSVALMQVDGAADSAHLFVDGKVGIGAGFTLDSDNDGVANWADPGSSYYISNPDSPDTGGDPLPGSLAALDIDGSIRIRGGG